MISIWTQGVLDQNTKLNQLPNFSFDPEPEIQADPV
jgi:hypothetical protein